MGVSRTGERRTREGKKEKKRKKGRTRGDGEGRRSGVLDPRKEVGDAESVVGSRLETSDIPDLGVVGQEEFDARLKFVDPFKSQLRQGRS